MMDAYDKAYALCATFDKTLEAFDEAIIIMKKAVAENNDQERNEDE